MKEARIEVVDRAAAMRSQFGTRNAMSKRIVEAVRVPLQTSIFRVESLRFQQSAAASTSSCPFSTLGLGEGASLEEVRGAHRNLCKVHHPDVGGDEKKFKEIQAAYESCKERIESGYYDQTAAAGCGPSRTATEGSDDAHANQRRRNASAQSGEDWEKYKTRKAEMDKEVRADLREWFRQEFLKTVNHDALDTLLMKAMDSRAFHDADIGEPLTIALSRYHLEGGIGSQHLNRCIHAMTIWETAVNLRASCVFYHILLTLYTNEGFSHHCDAQTVTENVIGVLERMTERGLPHDDWTLMMANRAFRTSPYPDW